MKEDDLTVEGYIKKYNENEWQKSKNNEHTKVNFPIFKNQVIHGCWFCGDGNCPVGVHLSGWKVVLEYWVKQQNPEWMVMQVGDGYCSKIGNGYVVENWDYHPLFPELPEDELLNMSMEEFWHRVEGAMGVDNIERLDKHNKEQIEKYEKELEELAEHLKKGNIECQTESERERLKDILEDKDIL